MRTIVLAALCLPLYGCSGQWMKTAQSRCAAFGFEVGSPQYADCVQHEYAANQREFRRQVGAFGAAAGAGAQAGQSTPAYHPFGARFFRYSYVSGTNRICVYDRMGSQEVQTIDATAICPLS